MAQNNKNIKSNEVKNNWRFERKFSLSYTEYLQFEKMMLISDLELLHPDRKINNCYLDTIGNSAVTESIEGYSEKMKTRFRWYGEFYQNTTPRLEFKLKQNASNKKEVYKLSEVLIDSNFDWKSYIQDIRVYLLNSHKFYLPDGLRPVLLNSYERSYYTNFDKSFRLTIDKNLKFSSPNGIVRNHRPYQIDRVIIELKSKNSDPLNNFSILKNLGKFSKFTTGIQIVN